MRDPSLQRRPLATRNLVKSCLLLAPFSRRCRECVINCCNSSQKNLQLPKLNIPIKPIAIGAVLQRLYVLCTQKSVRLTQLKRPDELLPNVSLSPAGLIYGVGADVQLPASRHHSRRQGNDPTPGLCQAKGVIEAHTSQPCARVSHRWPRGWRSKPTARSPRTLRERGRWISPIEWRAREALP